MRKINLILLAIFIFLAVSLNFIPHIDYSYPLHVDEWVHFQYSNHLSSDTPLYFGGEVNSLEAGFHYLLATLNSAGVPYVFMFTFFASLVTILICLGVFILTRRLFNETAGVFAVLFIALLKSTVMILGPVFFVPMAIGMFFIVISLFLIKLNSKALVLILASILIIHPPTAMAILLLINIEFLIKRNRQRLNLPKSHWSDAVAICNPKKIKRVDKIIKRVCITQRRYQMTKGVRSEKKLPNGELFGFRQWDKVKIGKQIGFMKGKRSSGYFDVCDIDKNNISHSIKYTKLQRLCSNNIIGVLVA